MKRKQPFILLELMIALALFALCGSFLMSRPFLAHKKEMAALIQIELERVAENSFFEVQCRIADECSFHQFRRNLDNAVEMKLDPIHISLGEKCQLNIDRKALLWARRVHEAENGRHAKLLKCRISLTTMPNKSTYQFDYPLFIKELYIEPQTI